MAKMQIFTMTDRHENLLAAYFTGQITDTERAEIITLLDSDNEFAVCFREMEEAYISACIPTFEKTKDENFRNIERRISKRRILLPFWKYSSVAACVVALVLLFTTLYFEHKVDNAECLIAQSEIMTITAKSGTGTETILPDGTRVSLNAESTLSFNRYFGHDCREVTLDGEGYFEVTSDADRPFRVYAGNSCVTVMGTTFNVRNYTDEQEITVSLLEGSVVLNTDCHEVSLKPGKCGVVSREGGAIVVEDADPYASAWTTGKIVFSDKSIPEILRYVERNYGVCFIYADDLFAKERFTGSISLNLSIDEILSYIDVDKKYRWRRREGMVEIYRK